MKTNILLLIAIAVGSLNIWSLNKKPEKLMLVTPKQKQCLDSWVGVDKEYALYGPQLFEGHSLVSVKKHFSDKFESDLSSCFYNRHSEVIDYTRIKDTIHFLESVGSGSVYFYKQPNKSSLVVYVEEAEPGT